MKQAIITIGVSASGKSTFAKTLNPVEWVELNRDNFRKAILVNDGLMPFSEEGVKWGAWKWKREKEVTQIIEQLLENAILAGKNIICSDTNLDRGRRESLIKRLEDAGYEVELKVFKISFEDACKRDALRMNGVGHSVIAKQIEQFNEQFGSRYKGDPNLEKAVIVDVDGTLAKMDGRGPFDWHRVDEDKPNQFVIDVVSGLRKSGYHIIVLSGRDGNAECFSKTYAWLDANQIQFDIFIMRREGDCRKDSVIKEEIFWREIAPNFNVQMVIDDRPQVTRMWRSIGLEVLQVGNPYIEF